MTAILNEAFVLKGVLARQTTQLLSDYAISANEVRELLSGTTTMHLPVDVTLPQLRALVMEHVRETGEATVPRWVALLLLAACLLASGHVIITEFAANAGAELPTVQHEVAAVAKLYAQCVKMQREGNTSLDNPFAASDALRRLDYSQPHLPLALVSAITSLALAVSIIGVHDLLTFLCGGDAAWFQRAAARGAAWARYPSLVNGAVVAILLAQRRARGLPVVLPSGDMASRELSKIMASVVMDDTMDSDAAFWNVIAAAPRLDFGRAVGAMSDEAAANFVLVESAKDYYAAQWTAQSVWIFIKMLTQSDMLAFAVARVFAWLDVAANDAPELTKEEEEAVAVSAPVRLRGIMASIQNTFEDDQAREAQLKTTVRGGEAWAPTIRLSHLFGL